MTVHTEPVLSDRIVALARSDFPDSELGTALWLLRECADYGPAAQKYRQLLESWRGTWGTTLVLAIEDRARLSLHVADR